MSCSRQKIAENEHVLCNSLKKETENSLIFGGSWVPALESRVQPLRRIPDRMGPGSRLLSST